MNDPAKYVKVGESLAAILDVHAIAMLHCAFIGELYKALEAPVTEIVTMTLNKGASKDTLEELVQELAKAANDSPPESGAVSAAWGPCVEKDDVFFLTIGWTSVEVSAPSCLLDMPYRGNQWLGLARAIIGPLCPGQGVAGGPGDHQQA